ncbi:hypothetical protein D5272_00940 [bacterium D16-76]|jgi:hypothetical protein|uniref:hypothetical protein n=1 Tax=Acutalibacter muris TaxID=1796620 RepID=UPI00136DD47D|nr:hypothetical protein [Acutalibacter muris]NBK77201.1 hypothetical protein [bacterium D16-76]
MPAQRYSQYFNIDEKYNAVVTKKLIDEGKVRWEGFFPHETFIRLLQQVVAMLSGKDTKSIWVEGTYGTGKSHAALTLKCLLEAPEEAVHAYFKDYGLSQDLCNKFLAARSEEINGKLIVVHRIGSSNIKNDDDLIWAVQDSISRALQDAGIKNMAAGTLKEALLAWINERSANKDYLASLVSETPQNFGGMGLDALLQILQSDDEKSIETLMEKLVTLCRENGILAMNMDAEKMAAWLEAVIDKNGLGAIVFIWDEFSEYFKNCQNSLTGFQTLTHVSFSKPFYFVIVTHESDGLITNRSDRSKISDRFISPRVHIELPDNMAFQLMAQAMKETDDPEMQKEWSTIVKPGLNSRLGTVRMRITTGAEKHVKPGEKTILCDDDLQKIVPLHPYAALILKHISRVFTSSQRSMFDFIVARDPDVEHTGDNDENILACRAFKWFINHNGVMSPSNLMTVDMLWDFFNVKAGGNMNPDALEILNNFDTLTSEYHLDSDQQRVLRTILLMNAICTRVQEADMLMPIYENIDLAFLGTGWPTGKAANIARAMVHRQPPLQPVLFEEPMQDGTMRVIPKATVGVDIEETKNRIRTQLSTKDLVEEVGFAQALRIPDNLTGHFTATMLYVNLRSTQTFLNSLRDAKNRAHSNPNHYEVCTLLAMTDEERSEANRMIQNAVKDGVPENLLLLDATTNTFAAYLETYITNRAYSEYYLKGDKKQSGQFAVYAQKNLSSWKDQVVAGELRLYDMTHKNGQMRMGYTSMTEVLQEFDRKMYPFGIEQYAVKSKDLFTRTYMGQGAECGLTESEKGIFTSGAGLSTALKGAWKVEGEYWGDTANQSLIIVQLKKKVEEIIHAGFDKGSPVFITDIVSALSERPFGLTPSNLSAFVLGFLLKEYACDEYFWSNGTTRPMSVELMKSAIKNAMDQAVAPKAGYRPEAIVTMSEELRIFLQSTASIFHESTERCGSVDAAAGVIRLGMKRLEFPIWVLKSILAGESLQTDTAVITDVIDKYLGIANIRNYGQNATESDLANELGRLMKEYPNLVSDLESLFVSQKCREGMKAYLDEYRGEELPALAIAIKDSGNYISEVKKKFNADEANWVWSPDTANVKIDETIIEYSIVSESNTMIAPAATLTGCVRNWRDRIENFRISLEAMATEVGDLKELLDILYAIKQSRDNTIPEMKKERFLELLREKKNDFNYLYSHQEEMFRRIAQGWISELSDEDITELFDTYMATGVFCDASDKFFQSVESQVSAYTNAQRSKRLGKLWHDRTETQTPADWSRRYATPILCMFDDNERQKAKEVFTILHKSKPSEAEFTTAEEWLKTSDCYSRLSSAAERDKCMRERVIGDFAYLLPDVDKVRSYLRDKVSMIIPYEWMDNSSIQAKIREMANMRYKTGGASDAEKAVANLGIDELRDYVRDLIKTDMTVGIAILKRQGH